MLSLILKYKIRKTFSLHFGANEQEGKNEKKKKKERRNKLQKCEINCLPHTTYIHTQSHTHPVDTTQPERKRTTTKSEKQ